MSCAYCRSNRVFHSRITRFWEPDCRIGRSAERRVPDHNYFIQSAKPNEVCLLVEDMTFNLDIVEQKTFVLSWTKHSHQPLPLTIVMKYVLLPEPPMAWFLSTWAGRRVEHTERCITQYFARANCQRDLPSLAKFHAAGPERTRWSGLHRAGQPSQVGTAPRRTRTSMW